MGFPTDLSSTIIAPSDDATVPLKDQRLAGSGTTESSNSTALNLGFYATLQVGQTPVRVSFRTLGGQSTQVATTSRVIGAYDHVDWIVRANSRFVYVEAADGSSAYEAWVANTSD